MNPRSSGKRLEKSAQWLITTLSDEIFLVNPLVPSVLNIGRLAKILNSIKEWISKKIPMSVATMSR